MEFYWNIFRELKKYNIEPLVTIWHGETPLYIENELLGWANRKTIELFKKYARTLFEEYKGVVHYWLTFNEINNALMFLNLLPTESAANDAQRTFTLLHHRLLASAEIVQMGHAIDPENKIGCMICYGESYPATCNPKDVIADMELKQMQQFYCSDVQVRGVYPSYSNRIWEKYGVQLDVTAEDRAVLKAGTVDFYSFSYYCTSLVTAEDTEGKEKVKGNLRQASGIHIWNTPSGAGLLMQTVCASLSMKSTTVTASRSWSWKTAWVLLILWRPTTLSTMITASTISASTLRLCAKQSTME